MKNLFVAIAIVCILCTSTASALKVEIKTPSVVLPNEKFNISIEVDGNLPTVVGVALNVPKEFTLVNCLTPYKVSGNSVSLAIINDTRVECTFKAPSSEGTFTFDGKWVDMLNEGEGKLEASISVSKVTATQITTTTATFTTTIVTTTSPTATTKQTPGFEFVTAVLPISLIALRRWLR
ncbi:hypothetical protein [Archaeoglobus profundus]|uniref:Uncharacterized protein n=1 Tax=Archaeoglobus profundus (strain DSM 5631 / JCM 9629 / NBRC 100127 / Av18) TaxID=572546 RepID=D2RDD1_ARCPA|nr:hypothetical protein [Archaeoglobus profundus]ADB58125.1 hypothetical protein Arcpr_1066 [Archaeoglobus profundus DSM 5631]